MRGAHIAVSLVLAAALAGCDDAKRASTDSDSHVSASNGTKSAKHSSTKASARSQKALTRKLKFGETYAGSEKVAVTVSQPRPFTPSSDAAKDPKFKKAVVVDITVKNGSNKRYSAMDLTVTATSGSQVSDAIFDDANAINSPNVYVQPGKSYQWKQAYGVNPNGDLQLKVENGVDNVVGQYAK